MKRPEPSGTTGLTGRQVLLAALVAGLLSAFGELALHWARQLRGVAVMDQSAAAAWMAPVGGVVAFGLVALALIGLGRVSRRFTAVGVVAFVMAFLAGVSVLTVIPLLHWLAACLLAAGVAWQVSALARRRPGRAIRMLRTGAFTLVPVAVVVGTVGGLWYRVAEARALGRLPVAESGAANVLFLILDTVRGEDLSLYGYERETTPALSALARESVVFDRAWAPAPWTLPSHASMFTGHWPHEISADWLDPLDDARPVLAEALAARGYATAGFVANLVYTHRGWGIDRGFTRYEDYPVSVGQVINSFNLGRIVSNLRGLRELIGFHDVLNRKPAADLDRSLLRWVDGLGPGRPFFAFVNYFDAHEPLFPPAPFDTLFGPFGVTGPFKYSAEKVHPLDRYAMSPARIQAERDAYDGAIAYLDHSIRALLDALEQRGILDNTLVIIASDHGEQFGEHGLLAHGNSVYTQLIRVPLLMRLPGVVPAGVRVEQGVSLAAIPATVMQIVAGATAPFPGGSLGRFWSTSDGAMPVDTILAEVTGGFAESDVEPITKGDLRSVFLDRWHYIIEADGRERLYDVFADPAEARDLAPLAEYAERLARMRAVFAATWRDTGKRPRLRH
ncbi:MAG: sulfatase [Gemmatimonadota bacterium]|jgi:arylsulfatase A-like enzyme